MSESKCACVCDSFVYVALLKLGGEVEQCVSKKNKQKNQQYVC